MISKKNQLKLIFFSGHLIIKKAFGHITENHLECLTTINLDLRDDSQSKSPKSHSGESKYPKKLHDCYIHNFWHF